MKSNACASVPPVGDRIGRFPSRMVPCSFCLAASAALLLAGLACRNPRQGSWQPALKRFEFNERQMGLLFRIVLYAPDLATAKTAAQAAWARVEALNQTFSDYETDSELNQLSFRSGQVQPVPVSPDLWHVLQQAQTLAVRTDGAFDVTVGPYSGLWRKARREKKLPDPNLLHAARARVGYAKLILDPSRRTARLLVKHMHLDLGGIAKGYTLDAALQVLDNHGLGRAMVAAGGDIVVGDPPPGKRSWRIELAPLDAPGAPPPRFVNLARAAIATSGDLSQHVEIDHRRYSHIVDPHTGLGLTDHSLVNVIAPDGITADSLATALSVLGPEKGLRLIESWAGTAALVIRQPHGTVEVLQSARFADFEE